MSRVAQRIVNALSIPESDVYVIGPNVVAVKPVWKTALQEWVENNGQKWYKNWFEKNYHATRVSVGTPSTQFVWCIHRGSLSNVPRTLAEQSVRHMPLGLGSGNPASSFSAKVQGVISAYSVGRLCWDGPWGKGGAVSEDIPVVGVQKRFAGSPFGADANIHMLMRPTDMTDVRQLGSGVTVTGNYAVSGTVNPVALPSPAMNMLLIEGPSSFDYGEVSPWYEFFLVMNATIRQDMVAANQREPSLKLRDDSSELEKDPTGGLGYLKMLVKTSINPFDMIPNFRPYAEEIFRSNQTIESVSMADIRSRWDSESVFIGGFAGDETLRTSFPEGVTDDDTAEALASLDAETVSLQIRSPDAVFVSAARGSEAPVTGTLTAQLAIVVAKRLAMRGAECTISVESGPDTIGGEVSISALMADLSSAINSDSVVARAQSDLRTDGQTDQVGYVALMAAAKLMSYDQRMISASLLIPGMVYDNATAALIAK